MYRMTKFVGSRSSFLKIRGAEIYLIFMVPNPAGPRLSTMENLNLDCEYCEQLVGPGPFAPDKESKLKLSVEVRNHGDVIVVHCQGRIVYRDEAAELSRVVGELFHFGSKLVLDLGSVSSMDSAGIGELVLLQTWARERNAELKCARPSPVVRTLLDLTNLDSVLDVHANLEEALESFHGSSIRAA